MSLHKYLYGNDDPINNTDPLGLFIASISSGIIAGLAINTISVHQQQTEETIKIMTTDAPRVDDFDGPHYCYEVPKIGGLPLGGVFQITFIFTINKPNDFPNIDPHKYGFLVGIERGSSPGAFIEASDSGFDRVNEHLDKVNDLKELVTYKVTQQYKITANGRGLFGSGGAPTDLVLLNFAIKVVDPSGRNEYLEANSSGYSTNRLGKKVKAPQRLSIRNTVDGGPLAAKPGKNRCH